jgi:hypothetical protein
MGMLPSIRRTCRIDGFKIAVLARKNHANFAATAGTPSWPRIRPCSALQRRRHRRDHRPPTSQAGYFAASLSRTTTSTSTIRSFARLNFLIPNSYFPSISPMRMQAANRQGVFSSSAGLETLHASVANTQRGWKAHPRGGFNGDGGSPSRMMRRRERSR